MSARSAHIVGPSEDGKDRSARAQQAEQQLASESVSGGMCKLGYSCVKRGTSSTCISRMLGDEVGRRPSLGGMEIGVVGESWNEYFIS